MDNQPAMTKETPAAASPWRETVRDIYDALHFGADNVFTGSALARRLIALIEARHPKYFDEPCEPAATEGVTHGRALGLPGIATDPGRCGGRPTLTGRRFTISQLLAQIAEGASPREVAGDFGLDEAGVVLALRSLALFVDSPDFVLGTALPPTEHAGHDEPETQPCAECGAATDIEALSHHGEDYDLCEACSEACMARIAACEHALESDISSDAYGDEGRDCHKCGGWFKVEGAGHE